MVLKAMYSGVSGLRAEGEALGVVGDNIANVNTTGFKAQRAIFQDVLGHSILAGTASNLPGSGVRVGDIQQMFTQGTITATGVDTDVALSGDGFFTVKGTVEGLSSNFYTRAGEFVLDKDGYLVNSSGLQVQGYAALGDGTFAASITSVQAPTAALPPRASTELTITANLDSSDDYRGTVGDGIDPFDITNPSATSNFSDTMTVYDSLGNAHVVDVYFVKQDPGTDGATANTWNWYALDGEHTYTAGEAPAGTGALTFDSSGNLLSNDNDVITLNYTGAGIGEYDPVAGTYANTVQLNLGEPGVAGVGLTQYASASNVSSHAQDGYTAGDFSGVAIDGQGIVMGLYTNGQKLAISQLAIAKFRSNDGLGRAGQNLWSDTRESGSAAFGVAGSGGRGAVSAASLESSNVDLAEEFVGLIQHQRSFSANSKTITTADEMLQELINIKR